MGALWAIGPVKKDETEPGTRIGGSDLFADQDADPGAGDVGRGPCRGAVAYDSRDGGDA